MPNVKHPSPPLRKSVVKPSGKVPPSLSVARRLSPLAPYLSPRQRPPQPSPSRQTRQSQQTASIRETEREKREKREEREERRAANTPPRTVPHAVPPSSPLSAAEERLTPLNSLRLETAPNAPNLTRFATRATGSEAESSSTEGRERVAEFEGSNAVFEQCITDDVLREWTGWEDLHLILSAEFRVNAVVMTGVDTLGERMPMLRSLKLNHSRIPQVRLLGTRFVNLKRLWLGNAHVENLRGIGACAPCLEELYAPFNALCDITPLLDLCETLEVVDLEGNDIDDAASLHRVLPLLRKVKYLTLQGNPVLLAPSTPAIIHDVVRDMTGRECMKNRAPPTGTKATTKQSKGEEKGEMSFLSIAPLFRQFVHCLMPNLEYLDDVPSAAELSCSHVVADEHPDAKVPVTRNKVEGANSTTQNKRPTIRKTPSTHVDPLDVALSEEYMFLQQCIRDCGFDALEEAVADETRVILARPSTSCKGIRQRLSSSTSASLRPHSANTLRILNENSSRPVSRSTPQPRPLQPSPYAMQESNHFSTHQPFLYPLQSDGTVGWASFASNLTAGGTALSGSGVRLRHRRRLLPLSRETPNDAVLGNTRDEHESLHHTGNSGSSREDTNLAPPTQGSPQPQQLPDQQQQDDVPPSGARRHTNCVRTSDALFDDEDEDEWESFEQRRRRTLSSPARVMEHWAKKYACSEERRSPNGDGDIGGLSISPSTTRATSASSNLTNSAVANNATQPSASGTRTGSRASRGETEEDTWKRELLRCVAQARSKTATTARIPEFFLSEQNGAFGVGSFDVLEVHDDDRSGA